ncbi:hypothetical protein JQC67_17330 [Aurantibacter crassamenti]|uniref:kelch repeat-containing protein n=1 Tax=Aurantibacter crassamenti TaxID=1837375 RepID=UPI00193A2FC6|nr:kelch repeat-containing protein [Aurantibacter crassamenti]MBM1107921.1 hypothetical protein [Aurantibacter crassamenti]
MKTIKNFSVICAALFFLTCSKDSNNESSEPTKQNVAPNAFNLTTIANEATEVSLMPSFSWQKASDADGDTVTYDFYLDTNSSPTTKIGSNLTATSHTIASTLDSDTKYYWSVTAKDSKGNTTSSSVFSFTTVANNAPANFNLLTLTNESENVSLTPSFTWEASVDPEGEAVTYEVYLDTAENPETKIGTNLNETSYDVTTALAFNTTYYWKVVAIDENENSIESGTYSFTTMNNPPPSNFELTGIENGATNIELLPTLIWVAATDDGVVTYDLYFGLNENPELFESDITETTFEITTELHLNQTYYWKVVAKDTNNNETESEIYNFTTKEVNLPSAALTTSAPFSTRAGHTSVVFDNKIWVIGGYNGDGSINGGVDFFNDIWSSTDGINWVLETSNPGFAGRHDHASIVYDNKIWVIGGKAFDVPGRAVNASSRDMQDVWNSSDGINWTQVTDNAPFSRRGGHALEVLNNKLYLVSGGYSSFGTEEIWSTTNGLVWTLEKDNLVFDNFSRHNHKIAQLNGNFYLVGGYRLSYDEIWKSSDLENWSLVKDNLDFFARIAPSFHNYNGNLLYFGGLTANTSYTTSSGYRQTIWYSVDGENWSEGATQAPYFERYKHTSVLFQGKIYMIAGKNASGYLNDVWSFD